MHGRLALGLTACVLALGLASSVGAEIPSDLLTDRLLAGARLMTTASAARTQDWELFALASALESLGQVDRAGQYWRYLQDYFPRSPLLALAQAPPAGTRALDYFEPDPDLSRFLRALATRLVALPAPDPDALADAAELLRLAAEAPGALPETAALEAFLARRPESPWAGWAAYQLLWRARLENPERAGATAVGLFARDHRGHPLGEEAGEMLDLRWVAPRRLALVSTLLPGAGEEILEPGSRESAGALYAEALYLAGAIAFTVGAQSGARVPNLTGALILYNLVLLNHSGSGARAYAAGIRANQGNRRRFLTERLTHPVIGAGRFEVVRGAEPRSEPLADDFVFCLGYRVAGPGDALRGRGWVREDQLGNLSLRLEWQRSLWDADWSEDGSLGFGVAPYARWFSTHAGPTEGSPLARGADASELGAGLEAAGWLRWATGDSWLQLRVSCGPGFRRRAADASGESFADTGAALTGAATLVFGAPGGAFWQIGASAEQGSAAASWQVQGRSLGVPALGWELFSGLGVRF